MTKNDSNPRPEQNEQTEALSATGMFLRAFDSEPESTQASTDPDATKPITKPISGAGKVESAPPTEMLAPPQSVTQNRPSPVQPVAQGTGPGEFTQMFQRIEPRQNASSAPSGIHAPPVHTPAESTPVATEAGSQSPADQQPGEFTRI